MSPKFELTKKNVARCERCHASTTSVGGNAASLLGESSGAQPGVPLFLENSFGRFQSGPLARYRTAGVSITTYEQVARAVSAIMAAPGSESSAARADFNRNPEGAKASLYHTHFRDDRERLSYAYGAFESYLANAGESDLDELFGALFAYEVSRTQGLGALVVHEMPTPDEIRQLEQARGKEQLASAERWETGSRNARNLLDVTRLATPAREHSDPLITAQFEPRKPVSGAIQGYQFTATALEPRDLLPKSDFNVYATDWERTHSAILGDRGFSPVVEAATPNPGLESVPSAVFEYRLLGYIGYATADSIYVPSSVPDGTPAETLAAVLENGLPAYAYAKVGKPLEKDTGYGGAKFLVSTDMNGKVLQVWKVTSKEEPPIESVASPIDFFGPKLVTSAGRILGGMLAEGSAMARAGLARIGLSDAAASVRASLGRMGQKAAFWSGIAMKGAAELPALTLEETPAAFVLRDEAEALTVAQPRATATSTSSELTADPRTTHDVFREVHVEMGLETRGTITYRSNAAAAAAATATGLHNADRPGFQTHSTASSVRRVLGLAGNQWQSVHMLMQAAYRALLGNGYVPPGGQAYSPGRALTTVDLSLPAHRAFDAGWVPLWNAAVASGQGITAGQVYQWLSNAINGVSPNLISNHMQGIILGRIRTELFVELGLNWNSMIVAPTATP